MEQTGEFIYIGGVISDDANIPTKLTLCISAAWVNLREHRLQLYDCFNAALSLKTRSFKAEIVEPLLIRHRRNLL